MQSYSPYPTSYSQYSSPFKPSYTQNYPQNYYPPPSPQYQGLLTPTNKNISYQPTPQKQPTRPLSVQSEPKDLTRRLGGGKDNVGGGLGGFGGGLGGRLGGVGGGGSNSFGGNNLGGGSHLGGLTNTGSEKKINVAKRVELGGKSNKNNSEEAATKGGQEVGKGIQSHQNATGGEAQGGHRVGLFDDKKYLKDLEVKVRVLIEENEKLMVAVEQKKKELAGYKDIERKIGLILNENQKLNELLSQKERENSLLVSQNRVIEKQNSEIEQLVNQMEEFKILEEENNTYKAMISDNQNNLQHLMAENGKLAKMLEGERRLNKESKENYLSLQGKYGDLEEKVMLLLNENEKLQSLFNGKRDEWNASSESLKSNSENDKKKIKTLITTNLQLNDAITELSNGNDNQKYQKKINEKEADIKNMQIKMEDLLRQLEESKELNTIIDELESKIQVLLDDNEKLNDLLAQTIKEKERVNEFHFKYEEIIQRNDYLNEEVKKLNEKIVEVQNSKNMVEADLNFLSEQNKQFSESNENLLFELEQLKNENAHKSQIITLIEEKLMHTTADLENEIKITTQMQNLILEKEASYEAINENCQKLLEQARSIQQDYDAKNNELREALEKVQVLEEELLQNREKNDFDECPENVGEMRNIIENLTNQVVEYGSQIEELNQALLDLKTRQNQDEKDKEIVSYRDQVSHWKGMVETKDKEIAKLYELLKNRKNESTILVKQNDELKLELANTSRLNFSNEENKEKIGLLDKTVKENEVLKSLLEERNEEINLLKSELENKSKVHLEDVSISKIEKVDGEFEKSLSFSGRQEGEDLLEEN